MEKDNIITTEAVETKKHEEGQAVKPRQRGLWWMAFILLAFIAGLEWLIQERQAKKTAVLIKRIEQLEKNNDLTQLKKLHIAEFTTLSQSVTVLAKKIDDLIESQKFTDDDVLRLWVLAEVEFLLRAANQSVLLTDNIENAITSLTIADKRLATLADPRLYALRSLISSERLALIAVTKVDIEGMAAQLHSMIAAIDTLRLPTDFKQTATAHTNKKTLQVGPSVNWQTLLSHVWQQIKSLVIIRHKRREDEVFLPPDQRYFLYQNLRLKLETARMALLSSKESVFYSSLISTDKWLQQYFIGKERDAMLATINALRSETISEPVPDISGSLRWLDRYQQQ